MAYRVKCVECDNRIQPQIAAENDGLCGQCVRIPPEFRAEMREYKRQLAEGILFNPTTEERASSSRLEELATFRWLLQPEYYAGQIASCPIDAIKAARNKATGDVFLVADDNVQLNLGFTRSYAVCEYQNANAGDFRYAYSESNCREQVLEELHVVQACPCCGVGMLWYASRFHMPREDAFLLLENAVDGKVSHNVDWLQYDDFSHTQRGRG